MQKYTKTTHRTVAWMKQTSDGSRLVLAAPYQRNPVWSVAQQSALIETILLEYPIPELYMQDTVSAEGLEQHIVVDGQQRTRAVLEFVEGSFELKGSDSRWAGLSFDDLQPEDKKKVFEYDFVVRLLPDMPDEQIRSIFQRINRNNMSLNAQELRRATYWGHFIKLMEDISDYEFWNWANIFSANDRRRMIDIEFISELAVGYVAGLQNKKGKLDEYYRIYEQEFPKEKEVANVFYTVLGELAIALPELATTRWRKKSDFYTLFLCLAEGSAALPLSKEGRAALHERLLAFASEVDQVLTKSKLEQAIEEAMDQGSNIPPQTRYARAVERAASDLGTRRARRAALMEVIGDLLTTGAESQVLVAPAGPIDVIKRDDEPHSDEEE